MSQSDFYLSCNIGLEECLQQEFQEVWPFLKDKDGRHHATPMNIKSVEKGGILIEAPLHLGLQLNFYMKLPHRILWRLKGGKKVKSMGELKEYLGKINWQQILLSHDKQESTNENISIKVSSQKSFLFHERNLEDEIRKWLIAKKITSASPQTVFFRWDDNNLDTSLDTSGEHLHKRGYRKISGEAPLRENLAAVMVQALIGDSSREQIEKIHLLDPMAGSGTLISEFILFYTIPGRRKFAFQSLKQSPANLQNPEETVLQINRPAQITLMDLDGSLKEVQKNILLPLLGEEFTKVTQQSGDSLKNPDFKSGQHPVWLICNPPYDERLKVNWDWSDFLPQLHKNFKAEKMAVLLPSDTKSVIEKSITKHPELNKYQVRQIPFKNGGIPVILWVLSSGQIN